MVWKKMLRGGRFPVLDDSDGDYAKWPGADWFVEAGGGPAELAAWVLEPAEKDKRAELRRTIYCCMISQYSSGEETGERSIFG